MMDSIRLERTLDVQAKLRTGAWIVEMDYRQSPMVERLVAVADVKMPKNERDTTAAGRMLRPQSPRQAGDNPMSEPVGKVSASPLSVGRVWTVAEVRKRYPKALR